MLYNNLVYAALTSQYHLELQLLLPGQIQPFSNAYQLNLSELNQLLFTPPLFKQPTHVSAQLMLPKLLIVVPMMIAMVASVVLTEIQHRDKVQILLYHRFNQELALLNPPHGTRP